jgi:hypothetical protein
MDGIARGRQTQPRAQESIVFENFAQLFLQLPLGEDIFHAAPGGFAALGRRRRRLGAPFGALQQGIEFVGFFGFAEELIVDVKMFVFAFTHFSRKALEINGIEQADT